MSFDVDPREAQDVLQFLISQTQFRTSSQISDATGLSKSGSSKKVRSIIAFLVEHKLTPIASCKSGFMYVNHPGMMRKTMEDLDSRVQALEYRKERIKLIIGKMEQTPVTEFTA